MEYERPAIEERVEVGGPVIPRRVLGADGPGWGQLLGLPAAMGLAMRSQIFNGGGGNAILPPAGSRGFANPIWKKEASDDGASPPAE